MTTPGDSNRPNGEYTGIIADWYDDFLAGEGEDILLYTGLVLEDEGPALELACGTGRLMLPLLHEGMQVDGVDVSNDMLERCREKFEAEGVSAGLFHQSMEDFETGRRYRTVFVSGGSFQLIPTLEGVRRALETAYGHLMPNGRFILDLVVGPAPFGGTDPNSWQIGRIASRGSERIVYSSRTVSDSFAQQSQLLTRYEHFREGELIEIITGELVLREYSRVEAELLLGEAGFAVERAEQRRIMSTHSVSVLFICRKPDSTFIQEDLSP
ncbi:MAG: class I SAM-dependent methyltransferase [Bacteroidota bacterium]